MLPDSTDRAGLVPLHEILCRFECAAANEDIDAKTSEQLLDMARPYLLSSDSQLSEQLLPGLASALLSDRGIKILKSAAWDLFGLLLPLLCDATEPVMNCATRGQRPVSALTSAATRILRTIYQADIINPRELYMMSTEALTAFSPSTHRVQVLEILYALRCSLINMNLKHRARHVSSVLPMVQSYLFSRQSNDFGECPRKQEELWIPAALQFAGPLCKQLSQAHLSSNKNKGESVGSDSSDKDKESTAMKQKEEEQQEQKEQQEQQEEEQQQQHMYMQMVAEALIGFLCWILGRPCLQNQPTSLLVHELQTSHKQDSRSLNAPVFYNIVNSGDNSCCESTATALDISILQTEADYYVDSSNGNLLASLILQALSFIDLCSSVIPVEAILAQEDRVALRRIWMTKRVGMDDTSKEKRMDEEENEDAHETQADSFITHWSVDGLTTLAHSIAVVATAGRTTMTASGREDDVEKAEDLSRQRNKFHLPHLQTVIHPVYRLRLLAPYASRLLARNHAGEAMRGLELLTALVHTLPLQPHLHYRYSHTRQAAMPQRLKTDNCVIVEESQTPDIVHADLFGMSHNSSNPEEAPVLFQLFVRGFRFLMQCSQPKVRMNGYGTLCGLFSAFSLRSRFRLLWDLLQKCPLPSIRALLLDWLRKQIDQSWPCVAEEMQASESLKGNDKVRMGRHFEVAQNPFSSPLVLRMIQGVVGGRAGFDLDDSPEVVASALNVYRFLLLRDRPTKCARPLLCKSAEAFCIKVNLSTVAHKAGTGRTGVWDRAFIKELRSTLLDPLKFSLQQKWQEKQRTESEPQLVKGTANKSLSGHSNDHTGHSMSGLFLVEESLRHVTALIESV